jgi:Cys-rich repeat protein
LHSDCPYAHQCDQTTNTCLPCLDSKHCAKFNKQHPICDNRIKKCVGCITDSDCATGEICSPQEECTPGCRNDSDCLTPGLRACDTSINQCVPCTNNSYCPAIKPVCNITSGADTCVECVNDSDCPNGNSCDAGICVQCVDDTDCDGTYCKVNSAKPKQNKCVSCMNDSQCASNPVNKVCDNSTNTCIGCRTSLDCPSGSICNGTQCVTGCDASTPCDATAPICDLQTETCKQCSLLNASFCIGTTPACKVDSGTCVPCTNNSFCPSDRAYCDESDNQCYECLIDANCGPGQVCDRQRKQCIDCRDDTDCTTPGFGYCDPTDQTCVPCYKSDQCKPGYLCKNKVCLPGCDENHPCNSLSGLPVCDLASNTCRQCISSTDCSGNRQFCANNTCVDCITSQQCIAKYSLQRPRCDTTGSTGAVDTCYECLSDSDCSSNPFYSIQNKNVCGNGTCFECDSDQNCKFDANLPYCNMTSQTCTECTLPSHCASGICLKGKCFDCDPANMNADGTNPTCQEEFGGKRDYCPAGNCVQCTGNGDCPNTSPICAKTTIPGTTIQANTCIGCQSNSDCQATNPAKPICDTSAAPSPICVHCAQNTDCSNQEVCINNKCGCNDNFDCSEPTGICASNNTCVPGCQTDQFCASRYPRVSSSSLGLPYCVNGICEECKGDRECPNNFRCSNNRCVQCVDSADCNLASYGYAANCVSGVCQKCQPTTIDTQNCPGDCQSCPREKPVCKATPIPGTSPIQNTYSCITCASDANCATDAECRGCICELTSGSSRIIQTGIMNSIQVSEKNRQSLSIEQCQGSKSSSYYSPGSVSSRTVYDASVSFDCFGPSVSRDYDVRSFSPLGGGKFTAGERIWFYYSGYVFPDEFVITLGQCDILLDYDNHASVQGGRGGVLGSYASTSSSPDGCVDSIKTRSSNPAGSSPCCRPSYNQRVCTETCAPGDKFVSFVLDKDYDEIFVLVYAPCQSTRWVYMLCTDSEKSACTNGKIQ